VTTETTEAIWVPRHVAERDTLRYVGRVQDLDGRCLHEERRSTGRWVCLLKARHKGKHG
jgi:hypothetical protein